MGNHLFMIGSPGTGKTLLAQRLGTILPDLTPEESLETTQIYSAVGRLKAGQALMLLRPFRSPHHTISEAGLVGGGSTPSPGEISLAHHGVLFLDELPEFNRRTLEVLRQPLEDAHITIARAVGSVTFPANLMLVAALNPCPCGYRGDPKRKCTCSPPQIERYMSKLSGVIFPNVMYDDFRRNSDELQETLGILGNTNFVLGLATTRATLYASDSPARRPRYDAPRTRPEASRYKPESFPNQH